MAAENTTQHETEIHDEHLKIPKIIGVTSNNDALLIEFVFVKQASQSIDNAKSDGHSHGGHAHKHGDEVVTIRKELQFHEIETEIKCSDTWISLGGFRMVHMLETAHSHSHDESAQTHDHDHSHNHSHQHAHHHHHHHEDCIVLCYPTLEINQYLKSHQLQWTHNGEKCQIRMRLRYKIAYRVAHLAEQIDSIISQFSHPFTITASNHPSHSHAHSCTDHDSEEKHQHHHQQHAKHEEEKEDNDTHCSISCLSLCSNRYIQIDNLSATHKSRRYLQSDKQIALYPNEWLFYPSLSIGCIANSVFSSFQAISKSLEDDNTQASPVLFCCDGFNKDNQTLCDCYAVNLQSGMWYRLPSVNNLRSRSGLMYAPNCKQLLMLGGYQYDSEHGTKYLDSLEYLNLDISVQQKTKKQLHWQHGPKMRANRCEHSIGLITSKAADTATDRILICGGSNDMFLRSSSILTVSHHGGDGGVSFDYKRGGLMKEACIKGSVVHDTLNHDGDNMYIIGGNNGFGSTRNAQCFNVEKNRWSMIKGTLYEHDDYPSVWMEQDSHSPYCGMIGVIGHSQQLSCVEYYDIRSDKWIAHCQYPCYPPQNNDPLLVSRMIAWQSK